MREFLNIWAKKLEEVAKCERGATAIEYAMIASSVTMAIVLALSDIEASLRSMLTQVVNGFN